MNRMRGIAAGLGMAALTVIGAACGSVNEELPASADFDAPPTTNLSGQTSHHPALKASPGLA